MTIRVFDMPQESLYCQICTICDKKIGSPVWLKHILIDHDLPLLDTSEKYILETFYIPALLEEGENCIEY